MGIAALVAHRDQLLRNQLFHPFGVDPIGQMHRAGCIEHAQRPVFIARPLQPQVAISLGLERRRGHRPQPRAPAQSLAADGGIDEGWSRHRRRAVEAFEALDRSDLVKPLFAGPCVNRRSLIAGVDGQLADHHHSTIGAGPCPTEQAGQLVPAGRIIRTTGYNDVINQPAFQAPAPGPDVHLDPVHLHIDASRQEQPTRGDLRGTISFAPFCQSLPFRRIARLDPCLAQQRVARRAQHLLRALSREPVARNLLPAFPAQR